MNLGKMCNQTCRHCHVDAGPDRREVMSRETMELCLAALAKTAIPTVDLTGGAPEMNPHFRWLVEEVRKLGRHVMDRCNLTILETTPHADLPEFFARAPGGGGVLAAALPGAEHGQAARRGRVREVHPRPEAAQRARVRRWEERAAAGAGDQPGGRVPPGGPGLAGGGVEARAAEEPRHPLRRALHHHQHAHQPVPGVAGAVREPGGVHGAAGDGLQPGRGARG